MAAVKVQLQRSSTGIAPESINDVEAALKLSFSQVKWSFFEPDTADQCAPRRIGSSFAVAALPRQ